LPRTVEVLLRQISKIPWSEKFPRLRAARLLEISAFGAPRYFSLF